jgi:N6-L-threonylcarbamoyladenine synthase
MKILSIETSCDETAISILEADGNFNDAKFKILANNLISQIDIHKKYGGVFPALAKREHSKNLIPILAKSLDEASLSTSATKPDICTSKIQVKQIEKILEREPELLKLFLKYIPTIEIPEIDAIAVTQGPGLEPALWVGINFAKALSIVWEKPLIPVNHMEGHMMASLIKPESKDKNTEINKINLPAISLLISGGHTELILIKDWKQYEKIGQTLDDAVGEAFDKAARMMDLPYPGGPEISKLAQTARQEKLNASNTQLKSEEVEPLQINLPRPMLHSKDFNFSFSGLKTAVLYLIKNLKKENSWEKLPLKIKQQIALEFEEAVIEILLKKTKAAIDKYDVKTLILGGGVIANSQIRQTFQTLGKETPNLKVLIPQIEFSTDNAIMIGIAGYFEFIAYPPVKKEQKEKGQLQITTDFLELSADGNLDL